jgi:hypothetical protein
MKLLHLNKIDSPLSSKTATYYITKKKALGTKVKFIRNKI